MIIYQSIKELNENIDAAKEIEMAIIVLRRRLASPLAKEARISEEQGEIFSFDETRRVAALLIDVAEKYGRIKSGAKDHKDLGRRHSTIYKEHKDEIDRRRKELFEMTP